VRSLARAHTVSCINRLAQLVANPGADQSSSVSVAAAQILMDRGWGKAPNPVDVAHSGGIEITVRKMLKDDDSGKT
jgi:hypothetical protein